jgi:hypothetical protein
VQAGIRRESYLSLKRNPCIELGQIDPTPMILDTFKLHSAIVQVTFDERYELWDRAGTLTRRIVDIWPGLALDSANPQEQTLKSKSVVVQHGVRSCTLTLYGLKLDGGVLTQIEKTFDSWRAELGLEKLQRVSCRTKFVRTFDSQKAANDYVLGFRLTPWPESRVFDQPLDGHKNAAEVSFRFEDNASFAVLRFGTEHLNLELKTHPDFENEDVKKTVHRAFLDFDRGLLTPPLAPNLRMDEWLKGYLHVLRRDIGKLIPLPSGP